MITPEMQGHVTETVVAVACAYECAAILSRSRIPTLSRLQSQHRIFGAVIVGWLCVHFIRYKQPVIRVIITR